MCILVYDAATSNFLDTHHHFLPQSNDVDDYVQSQLHIKEDTNPNQESSFIC